MSESLELEETLLTYLVDELSDTDDLLRDLAELVYNELMELERDVYVNAERYERSEERTTSRNGYYTRGLTTRVGQLELQVPQTRDGEFSPSLFERYERNEKAMVLALQEMYLKGVSTRKVKTVTEKLCGIEFSKDQVSHLAQELDEELQTWRERSLAEHRYPYLILDARYEKVRRNHNVVSQGVLVAIGVREDGYREIIGVTVADTESEATYRTLIQDLKARGLEGVRYVVSDAHEGLQEALNKEFQEDVVWQRCQVHLIRNALKRVAPGDRDAMAAWINSIFDQPTRAAAIQQLDRFLDALGGDYPEAADWVDDNLREGLNVYALPPSHRRRMKSTNALERLNKELKRRTRVIGIFPNRDSCLRLVTALCQETSEAWVTGTRYCDMTAWQTFDGDLVEWLSPEPSRGLQPPGESDAA